MQKIICIISLLGSLTLGFAQELKNFKDSWNEIDNYLYAGQTQALKDIFSNEKIENYSKQIPKNKLTKYYELLKMIDQLVSTNDSIKFKFASRYLKMSGKFESNVAGKHSHKLYEKFKQYYFNNNLNESIKYFIIAKHFHWLFIQFEKKRLRNNYKTAFKNFKQKNHELSLKYIGDFQNENKETLAYSEIGDSLAFRYNILEDLVNKGLIKHKRNISNIEVHKKWNFNLAAGLSTDKRLNSFYWNFIRRPSEKKDMVSGYEQNYFGFGVSFQGGYYFHPKIFGGIKVNYGIVFMNKISLGKPVSREAVVDYKRYFSSVQIYGKYMFHNKVGIRPYIDFGIGMRNFWNKEAEFPTLTLALSPGEKIYLKGQNETDPFINMEFGTEYLREADGIYIYTFFLNINLVLNNNVKIYRMQYFVGGKIGILLD